jgi:hypothetical protein
MVSGGVGRIGARYVEVDVAERVVCRFARLKGFIATDDTDAHISEWRGGFRPLKQTTREPREGEMGWIKASIDETCHVAWRVRVGGEDVYLHAIGDGVAGNRVTGEMAR